MFSLVISVAIAGIIAYAIYTSYFGDAKGDHVDGINAMIFVQNDLASKKLLKEQELDSFKRSLVGAAA